MHFFSFIAIILTLQQFQFCPRAPRWTRGLFVVVHAIKTQFTANQNCFSPTFASQTQDLEQDKDPFRSLILMFEILVGNLNEFIELPCEQWWQTIPQKHDYFFFVLFQLRAHYL